MSSMHCPWRATYTPGHWIVLSGPSSLVIMQPAPAKASELLNRVWDDVIAASSVSALLTELFAWGLDAMPNLAVIIHADGRLHSLLRGNLKVTDAATGEVLADGAGAITWRETPLTTNLVRVDMDEVNTDELLQLPLVIGAVSASAVMVDAREGIVLGRQDGAVVASVVPVEADSGENVTDGGAEVATVDQGGAHDATSQTDGGELGTAVGAEVADVDDVDDAALAAAAVVAPAAVGGIGAVPGTGMSFEESVFDDPAAEPADSGENVTDNGAEVATVEQDEEPVVDDQDPPVLGGLTSPDDVEFAEPEPEREPAPETLAEVAARSDALEAAGPDEEVSAEPEVEPEPEAEPAPEFEPELRPEPEPELEHEPEPEPQPEPKPEADAETLAEVAAPSDALEAAEPVDDLAADDVVIEGDLSFGHEPSEAIEIIDGDAAAPGPQEFFDQAAEQSAGSVEQEPQVAPIDESDDLGAGVGRILANAQQAFDEVGEQLARPDPEPQPEPEPEPELQPDPEPVATMPPPAFPPPSAPPVAPPPAPFPAGFASAPTQMPPAPDVPHVGDRQAPRVRPLTDHNENVNDGATVFATSIAATHKPAQASGSDSNLVLAAMCPFSHANAPGSLRCRVCGSQVDSHNPRLVTAPVLTTLVITDGQVLPLTGTLLIGRSPSGSGADANAQIVRVHSPNQDISRNHVRIAPVEWAIEVRDLQSTNGTLVINPGEEPILLSQGEAVTVEVGGSIDLGDGVIIEFRPGN